METTTPDFEHAVAEAVRQPIDDGGGTYLSTRLIDPGVPWDYRDRILHHFTPTIALLDWGTGDGKFLARCSPLPADTVATGTDPTHVPIVRQQLDPFGITVYQVDPAEPLPFPDARFDLVINQYARFNAREVFRVLRPGGHFLTEQLGGFHYIDLNRMLHAPWDRNPSWNLQVALDAIGQAGLIVEHAQEAFPLVGFTDIRAVIYYLRLNPWQVPDFQVDRYRPKLWLFYRTIQHAKAVYVAGHRFFLEATKTPSH